MNRALRRVSVICLVLFLALLINVNYVQGFEASSLANEPGNGRTFTSQLQYQRGEIVTSDGTVIAESRYNKGYGEYQRHYPGGAEFAPITGYDTLFSKTGVEEAENKALAGSASSLAVHNLIDLVTGKPQKGATVQVTINSKAQQAAYQGLLANGKQGGVVAIDPQTGAILAMASNPSFNPNKLATLDGNTLTSNDKALLKDPSQPLLNRAINTTFPPGSTFKIVTSSTAFETGRYGPQTNVPAPTQVQLPGTTHVLHNDDDEACGSGSGTASIITAFTESCDAAYAELAMKLGSPALKAQAEKFGFNDAKLTIPMLASPSNFPLLTDKAQVAMSGIGQFDDTVTPLQEAMLASAVANNGTLMTPYLVKQVTAPDLSAVSSTAPKVYDRAISTKVAGEMKTMMVSVVNSPDGTAHATANEQLAGVQIAGKTGTAQNGVNDSGLNDAVFTCFAPAGPGQTPTIAVGVVIKGGGYGAAAAAPIAVKVIQAYLGVH